MGGLRESCGGDSFKSEPAIPREGSGWGSLASDHLDERESSQHRGHEALGPAASVSGARPSSCRCLGAEPGWHRHGHIEVGLHRVAKHWETALRRFMLL